MRKILSCEFNPDTACVELRLDDGTLLAIDCTAVENEVANGMYQRSELDWLIYNNPLEMCIRDRFGGLQLPDLPFPHEADSKDNQQI